MNFLLKISLLLVSQVFCTFDISNVNGYDFSHLPHTGKSSQGNHLVEQIGIYEDRLVVFKNVSSKSDLGAQNLLTSTLTDFINNGYEPANIEKFTETVTEKIIKIENSETYKTNYEIRHGVEAASGSTATGGGGGGFLNNLSILNVGRSLNCVGCTVPLDLRDLFHYGCWCNLGPSLLQGQSKPLDEFDNACKALQNCMRCVIVDNDNVQQGCDPKVNLYQVPFFFFGGLKNSCEAVNGNTEGCNSRFCMCQVTWVNTVLDLSFQGKLVNPINDQSNFDYDQTCPVGSIGGPVEKECCGEYPARAVYNSLSSKCCLPVGLTYSDVTQMCCGDSVGSIGSC